jgi:hypothetical protein
MHESEALGMAAHWFFYAYMYASLIETENTCLNEARCFCTSTRAQERWLKPVVSAEIK